MKTIENSDMENKKNLSFKFKFPALFLEIIGRKWSCGSKPKLFLCVELLIWLFRAYISITNFDLTISYNSCVELGLIDLERCQADKLVEWFQ